MTFKDMLRRVLHPTPTPTASAGRSATSDQDMAGAAAWLDSFESGALNPPQDVHDPRGWDVYWTNQIKAGPLMQAFSDMMSSDDRLIPLLAGRHVRTILCAGNGLSTEALSLALHGFHVTALDVSSVPGARMVASLSDPDGAHSRLPGFGVTGNTVRFGDAGLLGSDVCPRIHRTDAHPPQGGGSLTFATGDLMDPGVCAGPFDAVIERRTVQLFPEAERPAAVDRLVSRLADRGLFVSHHHDGCGRPGETTHYATSLITARGFVLDYQTDAETRSSAPRLACLRLSTG